MAATRSSEPTWAGHRRPGWPRDGSPLRLGWQKVSACRAGRKSGSMVVDPGHTEGVETSAHTPSDAGSRVTIAEIAAQAGVSVATVSKVLNGRDEVAPATRERVQQLLDEASYERRRRTGAKRVGLGDGANATLDTPWAFEVRRGEGKEGHRARGSVIL